jgi:ribosomal protein S18 acetylase RimI-like enzyme
VVGSALAVGRGDLARLAARAFMDDPFYRWLEPDPRRRERLLVGVMRRALGGSSLRLEGEAGSPIVLIAVHDPDERPLGGGWSWALLGFIARPRRAWLGLGLLRALRRMRPREPHVHIEVLAVAAAARGRGVARRLMEPVLAGAAARGLVAHLETTNPDNVALYRRFGFEVVTRLEGALPTAWVMQRRG